MVAKVGAGRIGLNHQCQEVAGRLRRTPPPHGGLQPPETRTARPNAWWFSAVLVGTGDLKHRRRWHRSFPVAMNASLEGALALVGSPSRFDRSALAPVYQEEPLRWVGPGAGLKREGGRSGRAPRRVTGREAGLKCNREGRCARAHLLR